MEVRPELLHQVVQEHQGEGEVLVEILLSMVMAVEVVEAVELEVAVVAEVELPVDLFSY